MTGSMVFPDHNPLIVPAADVKARKIPDIPVALRDHAARVTRGEDPLGPWWTVGEFREGGEFVTAVARLSPAGSLTYGVAD